MGLRTARVTDIRPGRNVGATEAMLAEQIYAYGMRGYVGASARVAPLRVCH